MSAVRRPPKKKKAKERQQQRAESCISVWLFVWFVRENPSRGEIGVVTSERRREHPPQKKNKKHQQKKQKGKKNKTLTQTRTLQSLGFDYQTKVIAPVRSLHHKYNSHRRSVLLYFSSCSPLMGSRLQAPLSLAKAFASCWHFSSFFSAFFTFHIFISATHFSSRIFEICVSTTCLHHLCLPITVALPLPQTRLFPYCLFSVSCCFCASCVSSEF